MKRHLLPIAAALLLSWGASAAEITVVDGDTVKVDGKSWRLMGFDTPETFFARCAAEWRAGKEAAAFLDQQIRAHAWTIEDAGKRDRYRRRLGRLFLDGRDVAEIMIEVGHARAYNGRGRRKGWCG